MNWGSIINAATIFALALICARIGIEMYFNRKRRHVKEVIELAKEDK